MVSRRYRVLVIAASIGMLLVLLAGVLVTNTESGEGCGTDWPLCNGKFIPAKTLESAIEYSHRMISGVVGLLILLTYVITYRKYKTDREPNLYAGGALLFTVVQALMGAAAVKWPQSPPVLALHFGISLFAFACTMLLVVWAYRNSGHIAGEQPRFTVPTSFHPRIMLTLVYSIVVIYLGAYIRHTDSGGGCLGWPLCNGEVIPAMDGATGIVFVHRVAAAIMLLLVIGMNLHIRRGGRAAQGIARSGLWALVLVVTQIASGALLTATFGNENVYIFANLLHNLIVSFFFGILADMTIRSRILRERRN
ncbi:cytochrome Caa3 oxidase [Paenibacillus darwinianus]|uniref:Cytochrome Caa3 oxidase n=2 Tax=Paenibacillus darwinianus TaxID=1380763 RepID=A0A9W5S2P4_9BACL|nr:COX15/CtaA family protein [Paenibacillus darwinianus]EXX87743.1 cytochrome Caa3 oxidase [Paenibacillus darwinianus]EXX89257.1 cytochrome Caa3 oxidase [Paenibacillus darwinianus]EXX90093.1 cytochrome Caa3 oxidase [Paenibacillus darwinianus]